MCEKLTLFHLRKILPIGAFPLPQASPDNNPGTYEDPDNFPGGGINNHQSAIQWTDNLVQEAESSTSLAAAKPENIKNNVWPEVSDFFTPPEIMLYTNGSDNSQTIQPLRAPGCSSTVLKVPRRKSGALSRSAKRWISSGRETNPKLSGSVSQLF